MNFLQKIGKKHPKAINKFWQFQLDMPQEDDFRYLFDFFDEQGIHICIQPRLMDSGTGIKYEWWLYLMKDKTNIKYLYESMNDMVKFRSERSEAESIAFEKAFEILELELK